MLRAVREKNIPLVLAMLKSRISNRRLAELTGLCPDHLSKIINLRVDPQPETKSKIAEALGVPERVLFPEGGAS